MGTWHGVPFETIAKTGAMCGGIALAFGIALQAGLFHKFQAKTPGTWRSHNPVRYFLSTLCRLSVGVGFPLLYIYTGMGATDVARENWYVIGAKFGALLWLATSMPMALSMATFVNVHRGFVIGLLLDWALVCVGCGLVCAKFLHY